MANPSKRLDIGKGCVRFKSLENLRTPALRIQSLMGKGRKAGEGRGRADQGRRIARIADAQMRSCLCHDSPDNFAIREVAKYVTREITSARAARYRNRGRFYRDLDKRT